MNLEKKLILRSALLYLKKFNDEECINFTYSTIINPRNTINLMAKKFVRSGFESNSIETEDECLEINDIYILLKGNYSIPFIYNNIKEYKNQHRFFIERFTFDHELCLWHYCKEVYINNNSEIIKDIEPVINELFNLDYFELAGINYKMNQTTYYEQLYKDDSYNYFMGLKYFLFELIIIIIFSTLYTIYKRNREEIENNNEKKKVNEISDITINEDLDSIQNENSLFTNSSKTQNFNCYKILNAFNILDNFFLLNNKKEPLSNQNSLTELNGLIFMILFLILLIENVNIIIKFIDKGSNLLPFLQSKLFILVKIGSSSYECYKIICGLIFGFKFINYYKKEDYNYKRCFKFFFKFIPYSVTFFILFFLCQYHSVELVSFIKNSLRNANLSKKMNDCYFCHQNYFNIFNPLMFQKYNTTESYAAQYDGCFRSTLFTISEFICYTFIVILIWIFLKIKSKILEFIFFLINLLILLLSYFLSSEGKDLKYYTISRIFGFSGSIALPYLFFPLYYIGFNIGIIHYYNQNQAKIYNELNKEENYYIPFEYCFRLSLFLKGIRGKIKNTIMTLCLIIIVLISANFYFVINAKKNLFFEFNSFNKFMYVYEGILCGIFFSIFSAIYLSLNDESIFKIAISSDLLIFINKLSFVLFNSILTFLKIFHGINILAMHLSTFNIILNSLSLYIIIIFIMIIFAITILIPIKWVFFFITKSSYYDEFE